MDALNERVCKVMERLSHSKSAFANDLGVGLPIIAHITSGRNKPGVDVLQKILHTYPTVNATWLLIGKGDMLVNEKATVSVDNELNALLLLANEIEQIKVETKQVVTYHKLLLDEVKHLHELDKNILNSHTQIDKTKEKLVAQIALIKSKLNK